MDDGHPAGELPLTRRSGTVDHRRHQASAVAGLIPAGRSSRYGRLRLAPRLIPPRPCVKDVRSVLALDGGAARLRELLGDQPIQSRETHLSSPAATSSMIVSISAYWGWKLAATPPGRRTELGWGTGRSPGVPGRGCAGRTPSPPMSQTCRRAAHPAGRCSAGR